METKTRQIEKKVNSDSRPFLEGVVDYFEGDRVVIQTNDGQKILWPREKLPKGIKEGSMVKLHLTTNELETQARERTARDLLNEILKGSGQRC